MEDSSEEDSASRLIMREQRLTTPKVDHGDLCGGEMHHPPDEIQRAGVGPVLYDAREEGPTTGTMPCEQDVALQDQMVVKTRQRACLSESMARGDKGHSKGVVDAMENKTAAPYGMDEIPAPATTNTIEILLVTSNLYVADLTSLFIQNKYQSYQWNIFVAQNADEALRELNSRHEAMGYATVLSQSTNSTDEQSPGSEGDQDNEKEQEARVYQPSYAQHLSVPGLEIAAGSPLHSYSRTASDHHASRVSKSSGGADCGHSRFKSHSPIVHFKPEMNDGGVRASSTKAVPMPPPPGPFRRGHVVTNEHIQRAVSTLN